MLLSKEIMRQRYESARKIMKDKDLAAMFFFGDRHPGDELTGDFQYFANTFIWYRRHCVLLFPDKEPALISGSWIQTQNIKRWCWIDDCRIVFSDEDVFNYIVRILKERGVTKGRVGTSLYYVSTVAERWIKERLPDIELVEVHPEIMNLRLNPGMETRAIMKRSAEIADGAFHHVLPFIKAGATENKVRGEIDNYIYENGGDDCFTGVSAGPYSLDASKNKSRFAWPPTAQLQVIEPKDIVVLEITPRYDGYWSQIVRYVSVGGPNPDLEEIFRYNQKCIEFITEEIKPGNTIGNMCTAVREKFAAYTGEYVMGHNIGHLCGLDLTDGNLLDDSKVVMSPGMGIIVHPSILKADKTCEIFSGQTYMVTENGYDAINSSDNKVYVV